MPLKPDEKAPLVRRWRKYQKSRMEKSEFEWYYYGTYTIAIICGEISFF